MIDTAVPAGARQLSVALRETTETATFASFGAVESYCRLTDADAWLPAASTQPPEIVALALSGPDVRDRRGAGADARPATVGTAERDGDRMRVPAVLVGCDERASPSRSEAVVS